MAEDTTQAYDPQAELDTAIHESEEEAEIGRLIQERFGTVPDEEVSGPSESVEQSGGETSLPAEEETPSPTSDTNEVWEFDDFRIDRETAANYARFEAFLEANPQVMEAIKESIQAQATSPTPTTPTPTEPPVELDLEDPTVKFLWDSYTQTQQQLNQAMEAIQRHDSQLNTQTQATTESIVERAVASYKKEHNLTDIEIKQVREVAGNMRVIESLVSAVDPLTGLPRPIDPLSAVEKALDIAYWSIPEYRDREVARQLEVQKANNEKQRKLSSLGGSSGSVSREQAKPTTKEEIRAAMIREIAQATDTTPAS